VLLAHVLTITTTSGAGIPAELVQSLDDPSDPPPALIVGLARGVRPVTIVGSGAIPRATVAYAGYEVSETEPVTLLLTDLEAGATYRVGIGGTVALEGEASPEGALLAHVDVTAQQPGAELVVARCPPDAGAGRMWRGLCEPSPPPCESHTLLLPRLESGD
jgi:hypothetical protein